MRLDKYLWCVRKYKTRSIATEAIKKDRVKVNGEDAKASREIKAGDTVHFTKEGITYGFEVKDIPKSRVGAKLVENFIVEKTDKEELEKRDFMRMMRHYEREKGTGRPTKKERRDLDDFKDP